jgi:S1-C subfamily serine protease
MSAKKVCFAALAALASLSVASAPVQAQATYVVPDPYVVPAAPYRLGFDGAFTGYGMLVQRVHYGSIAQQIGLEPGDVILAINGRRIFSYHHYLNLLARSGGYVTLTVRDVRTGNRLYMPVSFEQFLPASPW